MLRQWMIGGLVEEGGIQAANWGLFYVVRLLAVITESSARTRSMTVA